MPLDKLSGETLDLFPDLPREPAETPPERDASERLLDLIDHIPPMPLEMVLMEERLARVEQAVREIAHIANQTIPPID